MGWNVTLIDASATTTTSKHTHTHTHTHTRARTSGRIPDRGCVLVGDFPPLCVQCVARRAGADPPRRAGLLLARNGLIAE